jgi:hypothetical protein
MKEIQKAGARKGKRMEGAGMMLLEIEGIGEVYESCIGFKREDSIPFHLIEELASKISVQEYTARASGV